MVYFRYKVGNEKTEGIADKVVDDVYNVIVYFQNDFDWRTEGISLEGIGPDNPNADKYLKSFEVNFSKDDIYALEITQNPIEFIKNKYPEYFI